MQPLVDARTLLVASAVVFAGLVVAVALAWRELRAIRGPDRLARGFALFFAGLLLVALRDRIPALLSHVVANSLIAVGAAFVLEGTRLFYGRPPSRRLTIGVAVVATGAFGASLLLPQGQAVRAVLSSVFLAALIGAAGWTGWRHRPRGVGLVLEKVTAVALSACALLFWARGVAVAAGFVEGDVLGGSPWLALPPLLCTIFAVVWTTTLLATTSRRLTAVVSAQKDLLASLIAVARAAAAGRSLDATLEKVLESTRTATGAAGASILLLDEGRRFTHGLFSEGDATLVVGPEEAAILLDRGLAAWVVRNRQVAVLPDVRDDPRWLRIPAQESTIRSALAAPIETESELYGVLTLVHPDPGRFGDEQRLLIESTTAQIALALRSAQVADARHRVTREQAVLNAVLETSARRTESSAIAREAAEAIVRGTSFARVFLALPGDDGRFRLLGLTEGLADLRPRCEEGSLGRSFESSLTQREDGVPNGAADGERGARTWKRVAIPLRHLGERLGVAAFDGPGPLDDSDVALAEALAEAISLGLGKEVLARAREDFSRMMVHDLRGPIAGVLGAIDLLREAREPDSADLRLLDLAERNARRQLNLVEGILELSRLEGGSMPVRHEEVRLPAIVDEVLARAAPAAEARGLTLASGLPPELPAVRADAGLVARVLENLVANAVKFSPHGSGPVRLTGRVEADQIVVTVRDSGPGVEESLRSRLFEKFAVGSLPGRGSGLGLPFCRLAIEAQGGRIWLESSGPSAAFSFSLPLATPPG